MPNNFDSDRNVWSKIEVGRMEYFLLVIDNLQMHPSVFLDKWRDISVAEFAELLEVEDAQIYYWCSRKKPNISKYYLLKIALLDLFFEYFEIIPSPIWERLMN